MGKKKNAFLRFICSLLPGAGEMYMGFMKMGVSLMSSFCVLLILANIGVVDFIFYIMTIVWFYSFFHVHNLAGLSEEAFQEVKDRYLFPFGEQENEKTVITGKYRKVAAVILIVIGCSGLLKSVYFMSRSYLPEALRVILEDLGFYYLPRIAFSVAVIILGICMIRGKKKQLEDGR